MSEGLNLNLFSNRYDYTEQYFNEIILKSNKFEVFKKSTIDTYKSKINELIKKGEENNISEEQFEDILKANTDLNNLSYKIVQLDNGTQLEVYLREKIEKAVTPNIPGKRGLPEGTIRDWKGGKYIKRAGEWKEYKEGVRAKKEDKKEEKKDEKKDANKPESYTKETSTEDLKKFTEKPEADEKLKEVAKKELENRERVNKEEPIKTQEKKEDKNKNYELVKEGNFLRITAIRDFNGIKKGEKGGLIEKESNLQGNAWVSENAKVSGDAVISENAKVYGDAVVSENASVSGNAKVFGDAWVTGNAKVSGNASVSGNAWVFGDAKVSGDASVSGNAKVSGDAVVSENDRIY